MSVPLVGVETVQADQHMHKQAALAQRACEVSTEAVCDQAKRAMVEVRKEFAGTAGGAVGVGLLAAVPVANELAKKSAPLISELGNKLGKGLPQYELTPELVGIGGGAIELPDTRVYSKSVSPWEVRLPNLGAPGNGGQRPDAAENGAAKDPALVHPDEQPIRHAQERLEAAWANLDADFELGRIRSPEELITKKVQATNEFLRDVSDAGPSIPIEQHVRQLKREVRKIQEELEFVDFKVDQQRAEYANKVGGKALIEELETKHSQVYRSAELQLRLKLAELDRRFDRELPYHPRAQFAVPDAVPWDPSAKVGFWSRMWDKGLREAWAHLKLEKHNRETGAPLQKASRLILDREPIAGVQRFVSRDTKVNLNAAEAADLINKDVALLTQVCNELDQPGVPDSVRRQAQSSRDRARGIARDMQTQEAQYVDWLNIGHDPLASAYAKAAENLRNAIEDVDNYYLKVSDVALTQEEILAKYTPERVAQSVDAVSLQDFQRYRETSFSNLSQRRDAVAALEGHLKHIFEMLGHGRGDE